MPNQKKNVETPAIAIAFRLSICDRLGMDNYNFIDAPEIIWVKR